MNFKSNLVKKGQCKIPPIPFEPAVQCKWRYCKLSCFAVSRGFIGIAYHICSREDFLERTSCCVHGAFRRRVLKPTINMAAAVRMRTWSCPTRGVFYSWAVLFVFFISTIKVVVAAPETGLWEITVVNVSILLEILIHPG